MHISQSLIKECLKKDHCPKQVYYSFVEGKELIEPSDNMLLGRYFESELLGACRGGQKQPAKAIVKDLKPKKSDIKDEKIMYLQRKGNTEKDLDKYTHPMLDALIKKLPEDIYYEKAQPYKDCDSLIEFAKSVFKILGVEISEDKIQAELKSDYLSAHLDLLSNDIENKDSEAIYDVKWTATKEDDRWNGWANPEEKEDAIIQATHYVLTYNMIYNKWIPFYFLVFGKDKWVKIIRFKLTQETIEVHKQRISYTAHLIEEYAENNYKGKGSFNKCLACPFNEECPDKVTYPEIETYTI